MYLSFCRSLSSDMLNLIDILLTSITIKSIGQANATQLVLVFLLLQRELSMLALTLVFIIKLHVKYALNSVVL